MEKMIQWYERDFTLEQAMNDIEANLRASVRNFVAVGFYLKAIRDRKLYQDGGYKNFEEFVRDKYDRDKGWASRCIKVNDQLSKDGNSPLLAEEYREYKVSQLVELAYLTEEQRSLASPDMTVKEIQAIRKPELDNQSKPEVVISQLLEHEPSPEPNIDESTCPPYDNHSCRRQEWGLKLEEQEIGRKECAKCWADWKERQKMLNAAQMQQKEENAAKAQQEELTPIERGCITGLSPYGNCVCCGADEVKCCGQCDEDCNGRCGWLDKPETEQPAPKMEYELRGKYCDAAARKLIESKHEWFAADHMNRVLQVNESEKQLKEQLAGKEAWYFADPYGNGIAHMNLFQDYIQFFDSNTWVGECEWFYLCAAIQGMWNVIAIEKAQAELHEKENKPELCKEEPQPEPETDQSSKVVDAEFTEIEKPEAENLTDLQIAQRELERANRLLEKCLRDLPDETNISIRGMKIKVAALASFICDLNDIENPPPKAEQPELPLLKNNDQRAAFVDAYESWPIWIETEETGERYYRYDLPDGTIMVVKVYHAMLFDYSMTDRPWEERFIDGYGCHEYYLLKPDKFFWDCKTNRSVLIDKLKEIQKKG